MSPIRRHLLRLACAGALIAPGAAARPIAPGHYCARDPLDGGGASLGLFTADLVLRQRGSRLVVTFHDEMPDSHQRLDIGLVTTRPGQRGELLFRFVDNWGASGKGRIMPSGRGVSLSIDRTSRAGDMRGDNADRNYGDFTLTRAACTAKPDDEG